MIAFILIALGFILLAGDPRAGWSFALVFVIGVVLLVLALTGHIGVRLG